MINLKVLSSAAVIALALPMAASAAGPHPGIGAAFRGGGAAPMAHFSAGSPAARFYGGGAGFHPGGVSAPVAAYSGIRPGVSGPVAAYSGGPYRGGYGGWHHHDHDRGRFVPGLVAGALVGGALAADSYAYYGGPDYYYGPDYADTYYDDTAVVAEAPVPVGDDAVTYCMQRYRSYDPASGTYLGYDGLRHPCP
ncbi:BA14K-like protein [Bradyrhizobium lablabi]|uniref:Lectin-like protein BA14k n=1 Tax=Bradyrhizobium lablabi TaxID=722472 RepID=A0A1M6IBP5_9BRAD|nr:BA14K family protein [Bradyrhizobium lablabi]SHJ31827.1 BA14K-like protein [Bradyrhizobium lablabi]